MALGDGFLTINIAGIETVQAKVRQFATWGANIETLEPVMEQIGEDILADNAMQFLTEGDFYRASMAAQLVAPKWEPLAPSTQRDRARRGYEPDHPILWRTGDLANSLSSRDAGGNIFEASKNGLRVGTSIPYASFHEYGTSRMPPRPLVGLTRERSQAIVRAVGDYVREQARHAGLNAAS
jgi:phage gpG-like protein